MIDMIVLRKASFEDSQFLFELRNAPANKLHFMNPNSINYDEHLAWLNSKLSDSRFTIYIASIQGEDFGQFRISEEGDVSVSILDSFKYKGLGTVFISTASNFYFKEFGKDLFAVIKKENRLSILAFEKAGYIFEENIIKEGITFYKYKFNSGKNG